MIQIPVAFTIWIQISVHLVSGCKSALSDDLSESKCQLQTSFCKTQWVKYESWAYYYKELTIGMPCSWGAQSKIWRNTVSQEQHSHVSGTQYSAKVVSHLSSPTVGVNVLYSKDSICGTVQVPSALVADSLVGDKRTASREWDWHGSETTSRPYVMFNKIFCSSSFSSYHSECVYFPLIFCSDKSYSKAIFLIWRSAEAQLCACIWICTCP